MFGVGQNVKRTGSSYSESEVVEALGMTVEIKFISSEREWPPNSGKIIPKMYVINFPELYPDSKHGDVLLGVVEEDLELVLDIIPTSVKIGLGRSQFGGACVMPFQG